MTSRGTDSEYFSEKIADKKFECSGGPLPVSQFNGKFPDFRRPAEIGSFSLVGPCDQGKRDYIDGRSQLRVFSPPLDGSNRVEWNLGHGYDVFIKRDRRVKERLDHLLQWIIHRAAEFKSTATSYDANELTPTTDQRNLAEFVCWRGLLTKILCTPYENSEGWKIAVCRYRGTLYMCEFEPDQKLSDNRFDGERQLEMTYWGFKFETYITASCRDSGPDTVQPVNNNQAFVSVVHTKLNKHSLVFGGEVDCCERTDEKRYIELKTSRLNRQNVNFKRYKLIKWWAQSLLVGIDKIVCGLRNDNGIVLELRAFATGELPKYCDVRDAWNADVCFNFCDRFLQIVKDNVVTDYNESVYVFEWSPDEAITCEVEVANASQYAFLPSWYTADSACAAAD